MHDRIFHGETEGEFYEMDLHVLNLLKEWCPRHSERVLEVGCGTGYWIEHLTEISNAQVLGVDISPEMLAFAVNRFFDNLKVEFHEGDVRNLNFLKNSMFDFTFCAWILQYLVKIDDFLQGLRELKRVSKPGGLIFLAEDSPPTKAPFTDCLIEKDELGGIYFYEDKYEGMILPVYRRLLESSKMIATLERERLDLLFHEEKISLKVYIIAVPEK